MRQRVGMARAFCLSPEIFFADEAFGHLDQSTARRLREVFLDLVTESRKTCLLITHNIHEALEIGSRLVVLGKPGRVLADMETPTHATRAEMAELEDRVLDIIENNRSRRLSGRSRAPAITAAPSFDRFSPLHSREYYPPPSGHPRGQVVNRRISFHIPSGEYPT